MLKIILGEAGSGKTAYITREIKQMVENKQGNIIFIVPEQFSFECHKELCSRCGDTLSLYATVTSFKYFTDKLAVKFGGFAKEYLDDGGKLLCMAMAVRTVGPALEIFSDAQRSPETQNALLSAIDDIKSAGITDEQLRQSAYKTDGDLQKKLNDLAMILSAYDSIIENGHADSSDRMMKIAQKIQENRYGEGKKIFVDGFSGFTVSEMAILVALMKTGADLTVCLTMDKISDGEDIFTPSRITAMELVSEAGIMGTEVYSETLPTQKKEVDISLYQCDTLADECEFAAIKCKELVSKGNCRYRDIAIAVRGFKDYRALLRSVFERFSIPLFLTERNKVSSHPLPTMIECAYDIVLSGWNSDDIISFIGTGLAPISFEEADILTKNLSLRRILEKEKPQYLKRFEKGSKKAVTARDHIEVLGNLLSDMKVSEMFDKKAKDFPEYLQMWNLIVGALEQFEAILGDCTMSAEEFSRLIKVMLSKYDIGLIPLSLDSVSAGDFDRMRRRNLKHLIVLGANDDRLPASESDEGIFTKDEVEDLSEIGLIPGYELENDLWKEPFLIYNCTSLPSESITYTYSANKSRLIPEGLHAGRYNPDNTKNAYLKVMKDNDPDKLDSLVQRAEKLRGNLSIKGVELLYGNNVGISASRADKYYSCKYAYFCKYGLKAEKWEKEEFTSAEMGTFIHYVLEHVLKDGKTVEQAISQYVHEEMNDLEDKSERYKYLFRRLEANVRMIVEDTANELKNSKFVPEEFEMNVPGYGIIDRVDSWKNGGKKYVRIADYKTGTKEFKIQDIYSGLNMQMLMYLNALKKDDNEIVPAGIMYIPAKVRYLSADSKPSDDDVEKDREKYTRRSGIILNEDGVPEAWETSESKRYTPKGSGADSEQFELLSRHIERRLNQMRTGICNGEIEANPYRKDSSDMPCRYCEFSQTCGFSDGEKGEKARVIKKIKDDEVWEKLKEEDNNG